MAENCVNRGSSEFLDLQSQTQINPIILASKVSLWQDINGLDKFPSIEDLNLEEDLVTDLDTNLVTNDSKQSSNIENLINKFYSLREDTSSLSNQLIDSYNNKTEDTLNVTEQKIELMKQALNAEVIVDTSITDSGQLLPSNHPLSKKYGKPVIVINPNNLFADTVFHEFGHLYIDLLKEDDSVLNEAYELLRGTEFYNNISKQYPELNSEQLDKEVLATALGLEGDKIFKQDLRSLSIWQKLKTYILNKLKDIFNIEPNALEQLASELVRNKVRVNNTNDFNSTITQRSKYIIEDNESLDKQKQVSDLLDKIQSDFTKETIEDENIYKDKEGNIYNNSVTKNISKYKKRYNSSDKGDYEMKFDKTLYNKDNILFQLNSPKLPLALTKALNDLVNDRIKTDFNKNPEDKNWLDAYNREINNTTEVDELDVLANNLLGSQGIDNSFTGNLLKHFDIVINKADEYQGRYNQAPIVGNIVHNAIENYVNDNTTFPKNIIDINNKLINQIKSIVDKGSENGSIFKTEQILYSENRQVPGTADLIEITKSGEVIIYDYKTTDNLKWGKFDKSDESLYFNKGYIHQLLSYGAILNQYGINLTSDPYHIILAEVGYSNVQTTDNLITIKEVRSKSLSDKNLLGLLNSARNSIYNDFASTSQLDNINIKPDIQNLSDLVNRINNYIKVYKKRTKNLTSNLDSSNIDKIQDDLIKQKDLEKSINEYVAKNNQVIINSYVNNIQDALGLLESQKEFIGENLSSEYLQSLNYVLQSTEALGDIKKLLEDGNNEITLNDKIKLLSTIDKALLVINNNKNYYKDKLQRLAINSFVENSNLMYGLYREKYQLEAKKKGLRGKDIIEEYVTKQLKANETEIKIKEINYWTKQYEDGFTDLRFLEYLVADPGISKSQFVQLVKNILDKTDQSIRNKMLDVIPDIANWYDNLDFEKTGDPRKVWSKFIDNKTIINAETGKTETKLASSIISEFTSEYRKIFMQYENAIKEQERYKRKLENKSTKTKKDLDTIEELKNKIVLLKKERQVKLKEGKRSKDDFDELYINPEFEKLSTKEKETARFIHKQLLDADSRLYSTPEKRLTKELADGSYIYYLPKERMSGIESTLYNNKAISNFKSKFEDFVRPPADEDEFNIEQDEYNPDNKFNQTNLDIYGNEVFNIPVYYRNELEDEELQSYDIPTLLALNHETTITFQENKLVEADLFVIAESLNSRNNNKILKTDSFINKKIQDTTGKIYQRSDQNLVYQAVKSSIDNRLYKRSYKGVYSKGNYKLIKGAEAVSKYASTLVLTGNFMSALSTFSQGSIYRLIESQVGEHITTEDWKAGTAKAWKDFPNMLADTQKFVPESKSNLLIRKFGLETTAKALTNKFVQDNFAKKQLDSATLFSVTSMAEAVVTSTLMYSLLNNIKVTNEKGEFIDQDGKIVAKNEAMSLDEAYTVNDRKLDLNKHVRYTTFNITEKYNDGLNKDNTIAATEVSRYIRSVYADLYGQYNQDMKSVLQRTIWGKLAMSLRGWLPRGVNRRWRGITDAVGKDFMDFNELRDESNIDKRFYSQDQKQFQEGHYTTSIRFLRSIYKEMKQNQLSLLSSRSNVRNSLTDHEIANLKRTQYELGVIIAMASLAMFLRVIALNSEGDDDDKEKIYFAAYLAHRIQTELTTFISPSAMFEMLSNPAASMSVIQRVFDWMWQLTGVSYSKDEGFNANINDVYSTGTKKDESKALIKTLGLVPGFTKVQQIKSLLGLESTNNLKDSFNYSINN